MATEDELRIPRMDRTILECIAGSTVHGTSVDDGLEDLDLMAIRLETREQMFGFTQHDTWTARSKPQGVRSEAGDVDYVAYGLRKYLSLALKGNPTVLLALFVQLSATRHITVEGEELRAMSDMIVSKACFAPFRGYMKQQRERLYGERGQKRCTRPELIERYGFDTKYAGHVIRLGLQGIEILTEGRLTLPMKEADRTLIVGVRTGAYSLKEIAPMIDDLEHRLEVAKDRSELREEPNFTHVERWMRDTYMRAWNRDADRDYQATIQHGEANG